MPKRYWLLALVLAVSGLAAVVLGQAGPSYAWSLGGNVASAAQAQSLIYTLYVNDKPSGTLTGVTCTGTASPFNCTAPVPPGTPMTIDTRHELTAKTSQSAESPRSNPFIQGPDAPINFRRQ